MKLLMRNNFIYPAMLLLFLSSIAISASSGKLTPANVVEEFCQAEFNGVRDIRFKVAAHSLAEMKKIQKLDSELKGNVVFWDADTVFVVSSFNIGRVIQGHDKATIPVTYNIVLGTQGNGIRNRTFVKKCVVNSVVRYTLIKQKGEWRIYDPPAPYISLVALIKYYKNEVKSIPKNIEKTEEYTALQKNAFKKIKEALLFLEEVSDEKDYCRK